MLGSISCLKTCSSTLHVLLSQSALPSSEPLAAFAGATAQRAFEAFRQRDGLDGTGDRPGWSRDAAVHAAVDAVRSLLALTMRLWCLEGIELAVIPLDQPVFLGTSGTPKQKDHCCKEAHLAALYTKGFFLPTGNQPLLVDVQTQARCRLRPLVALIQIAGSSSFPCRSQRSLPRAGGRCD